MTARDFKAWISAIGEGIISAHILCVATGTTMAMMSDRIWGRGELTDGSTLKYNGPTKRGVYIYVPPWPKKGNGKGKPNAAGKSRKIKGTWAPSYIAGKRLIGRGETPFELTGDLRKDWLGGVIPTPKEDSAYMCTISVSEKSLDKIEGLSETKGDFTISTPDERSAHREHVLEAYRELVLKKL